LETCFSGDCRRHSSRIKEFRHLVEV
jgi:hypothetical protein